MNPETIIDGRYKLDRELRRTDRLTAYSATDTQSGLPRTIKLLRADLLAQPDYRREFDGRFDVIKAASTTWVVSPLDFDFDCETPYIVEPVLTGSTVGDKLRRGEPFTPLSLAKTAASAEAVLKAIQASALTQHGGITPDTVFVGADGVVRLLDPEQPAKPIDSSDRARYAAPEILADEPADATADQHSLCCVLYEAAVGQPPFSGASVSAVSMQKVSHQPDPISNWRADVPANLAQAIMAGLQKETVARPRNMQVIAEAAAASLATSAAYGSLQNSGSLTGAATAATAVPDDATVAMPQLAAGQRPGASPTPSSRFDPSTAVPQTKPPTPQPGDAAEDAVTGPNAGPWIAGVIVVLVLAALYFGLINPPGSIRVPALSGLSADSAMSKLKDANLKGAWATPASDYDDSVPEGQVLHQDPAAGARAKQGDTVKITLSKGSRTVMVPNVVNLSERDAKSKIQDVGLKYGGAETVHRSDVPDGVVVEVFPDVGKSIDRGATVRVSINKKPKISDSSDAKPSDNSGKDASTDGKTGDGAKDQPSDAKGQGDGVADQAIDKAKDAARGAVKEGEKRVGDWVSDQIKGAFGSGSKSGDKSGGK